MTVYIVVIVNIIDKNVPKLIQYTNTYSGIILVKSNANTLINKLKVNRTVLIHQRIAGCVASL